MVAGQAQLFVNPARRRPAGSWRRRGEEPTYELSQRRQRNGTDGRTSTDARLYDERSGRPSSGKNNHSWRGSEALAARVSGPCYTGRMGMDIYDQYERDADQYFATHGLRIAADMLPAAREILVRETRHEADTYAGKGAVPGNTHLMRICAAQLWHAGAVEDALLVHRARRAVWTPPAP